MDAHRSTMGAIFFDQACDKFHDSLEVNRVYTFKNGQVKESQYDAVLHLQFDKYAIIQPHAHHSIPDYPLFSLHSLRELAEMEPNSLVDVVAVVLDSKPQQKRLDVKVYDETAMMLVTLTGFYARIHFHKGDILSAKSIKLTHFAKKPTLSSIGSTVVFREVVNRRAHQLQQWHAHNPNYHLKLTEEQPVKHYSLKEL